MPNSLWETLFFAVNMRKEQNTWHCPLFDRADLVAEINAVAADLGLKMKGGENGFASYTRALVQHIHKYSVQDGAWPLVATAREALSTRNGGYGPAITNSSYWSNDGYQNFLSMVEKMKAAAGNQIDSDRRASKASQLCRMQMANCSSRQMANCSSRHRHRHHHRRNRSSSNSSSSSSSSSRKARPYRRLPVAAAPTIADMFKMMQRMSATMQTVSARLEGQAQQIASLQAGTGDGASVNSALTEGTGSLMDGYGNINRS